MTEIVRVDGLIGYRELVNELGGNGDALLREGGIEPAQLSDPDAYIPFRKLMQALERAAATLKRRDFGMLLAERADPRVLGPVAVAMQNAETGRQGLESARRYMHFHNTALKVRVEPIPNSDNDFIAVDIVMRRPPRGVQACERIVAATNKMLRFFGGADYRPQAVWFCHRAFAPLDAYRRVFSITPDFEMPDTGLAVSRAMLDRRLTSADPQMRAVAEAFLRGAAPPETAGLAPRARYMISKMLRSGDVGPTDLARMLGLTERTLQRRLQNEAASFEALKDEARADMALTYLAQPDVAISHISELVGYAETSAFTRAAKRWWGKSPRAMRKSLQDAR